MGLRTDPLANRPTPVLIVVCVVILGAIPAAGLSADEPASDAGEPTNLDSADVPAATTAPDGRASATEIDVSVPPSAVHPGADLTDRTNADSTERAQVDTAPDWRIGDIDVETETVTQGENVTVRVAISSLADTEETEEIHVKFAPFLGHDEQTVTRDVTLGPGEDIEFAVELPTDDLPPAEYSVFAKVGETGHEDFAFAEIRPGGDGTIFYQVDFIAGQDQPILGPEGVNPFYGEQDRLFRFLHGSSETAVTRGGSPGSNALADEHAECVDSGYIAVDDDTASITFTIEEGCDGIRLTLVSYVKPGPGFDRAHLQVRFERTTGTFDPGTHTVTVDLPTEDDYKRIGLT